MRIAAFATTVVFSALVLMGSCLYLARERPTVVSVNAGPSFRLSGSGQLALFKVYAPKSGSRIAFPHQDDSSVVWQIQATKGYFEGAQVDGLQLTYGKVPDGYTQVVPSTPVRGELQPPPPLNPGAVYSFWAETTNAPIADGFFYMDKTEPIQTYVPGLCLTLENGREVRVKCGFGDDRTYREPSNLEEMARKCRIKDTSEVERLRSTSSCEVTANQNH